MKRTFFKIFNIIKNKKQHLQEKFLFLFPIQNYTPFKQLIIIKNYKIEYNQHEKHVFIKNMPSWYEFIFYNKYMFRLRYVAVYWLGIQGDSHQEILRDIFQNKLHIENYHILKQIFFVLTFLTLFYLIFIIITNIILRFVFIKELMFHSPFNWTMNQIGAILAGVVLFVGVGSTTFDNNLKEMGYKPLNQGKISYGWYHQTDAITEKMASKPYKDYKYFDDNALCGTGKYLKKIQEYDQSYYDELANVYENRQKQEELLKLK
uniref:hypothetical protein n=1 Tax=Thecamoeba quadrilineata TaxID=343530 RepID=UPI00226CB851|nr:hypothetical protein OYV93_mgp25 [Thecamoeba quadrilineata]UZN43837.1 hypothetical protein [Thecamoeba quadrilineata]